MNPSPAQSADKLTVEMTPADLEAELAAAREETDLLFSLVSDEQLYSRPIPQRNRIVFYVGHIEAFDWNQVARFGAGTPHIDATLERLFERGIDPEPGQLPSDRPEDWPKLHQIRDYVSQVRQNLDTVWNHSPLEIRQCAVEHRRMHAETLAYMFHSLPHGKKRPPALLSPPPGRTEAFRPRFIEIPAGRATLGRSPDTGFGWDNEFRETTVNVPAFSVSKYKITNGEYMDYVKQGHDAPFFWECLRGEWFYRGMFDFVPLPLDAPVYVTQHQAQSYALWRGMSLPTEAQFHRAAYGTTDGSELEFPWGSSASEPASRGNFASQFWDPVPVLAYPGGESAFGAAQTVGNGWEWTSTPFGPFPGFEPMPNYTAYSADFFDDKHFVMKGASPRTAAILTRRSLRNWFRPDYPYVYATFRLVEN